MSRVIKTANREKRMKASEEYKNRLAEWVRVESERCGGTDKLAARISLPEYEVSGAQLRKFLLPLDHKTAIVKQLGPNMIYPMASYSRKTSEEFALWLQTGSWAAYAPTSIEPRIIQGISDLEHLIDVQRWLNDRLIRMLDILADLRCPTVDEGFRESIAVHARMIEARRSIPRKRIMEIAAGGLPTLDELAQLSRYFVGEEDANLTKLLALYPSIKPKQKTAGSIEAPPGGRRTRAQPQLDKARSLG
jgi:hypothetical protein